MSDSLRPHGLWPTRLLCPWDFPGKSTGVGCPFVLQRIFPTKGSNPGLPHCRQTPYCLSHQGSPYRFSEVSIKCHFSQSWNKILKFVQSHKRSQEAKAMRKKNKAECIILPDFIPYYKVMIITSLVRAHTHTHTQKKKQHTDQWNRIESPLINPCLYDQCNTKEARLYYGGDSLSNDYFLGKWASICKRIKLDHSLTSRKK